MRECVQRTNEQLRNAGSQITRLTKDLTLLHNARVQTVIHTATWQASSLRDSLPEPVQVCGLDGNIVSQQKKSHLCILV